MKLLRYQPHQKITYSAGLISLIVLPVLVLCWLYRYQAAKSIHAIDIVFWSSEAKEFIPKDYWLEAIIKKESTVINLTGNDQYDKVSLQYAQVLLSNWKANKDDTQVLNFHFGNKAKYWTFIEAINVCKAVKLNSYMPYQNNIYAYWNFHSKPFANLPVTLITWGCDIIETKEPVDWSLVVQESIQTMKDYWAPGVIFILMIIFTLHKIYRRPSLLAAVSQ
jgi:hypothetical protein